MKYNLFKVAFSLVFFGGLLLLQLAPAHAQFHSAPISGLTVTLVGQNASGFEYSLSLSKNATITFHGMVCDITGVSSFLLVGVSNAGATTNGLPAGWQFGHLANHASGFSDNKGQGGFGKKTNYLKPGETLGDFTFTEQPTAIHPFGFHIQYVCNGKTYTGFFTPGPVPEPGFVQMAGLLAMGGLGTALRKVKKRRSA